MMSRRRSRKLIEAYLRHSLGAAIALLASATAFWVEAEPYQQGWRSEPLGRPVCGPYGDFSVQARGLHSDIVVIEQVVGRGQLPGPMSADVVHTADYVMRPFACRDVLVRFKPNNVVIISHPGYGTDFYGFRPDGSVVIGHEEMNGVMNIDPAGRISMERDQGEKWAYCWSGANWTKGQYQYVPTCDPYHWMTTIARRDKPNSGVVITKSDSIRPQPAP